MDFSRIQIGQISDVKPISRGHPVYRAKVNGPYGEKDFVIKAESRPGASASRGVPEGNRTLKLKTSLKWMAIVHGIVSYHWGFGDIRVLTKNEVATLASKMPDNLVNDTMLFWYLMELVNVEELSSFGKLKKEIKPDDIKEINRLKKIVEKEPIMFKELGAIMGADMFNGNQDRFCVDMQSCNCKVQNWGNIFINHITRKKNNNIKTIHRFIGIDFYEAQSPYKSLNQDISQQNNPFDPWPGEILRNTNQAMRKALANTLFQNMKAKGLTGLKKKHEENFLEGLENSRKKLQSFAKREKIDIPYLYEERKIQTPAAWPVGLKSRFQKLGWI